MLVFRLVGVEIGDTLMSQLQQNSAAIRPPIKSSG